MVRYWNGGDQEPVGEDRRGDEPGRRITDQPPPIPSDRPAIWPLVIADCQDRHRLGVERYGTPLQPFNGREALVDAYQEQLDKLAYLRQEIEERRVLNARVVALETEIARLGTSVSYYTERCDKLQNETARLHNAATLIGTERDALRRNLSAVESMYAASAERIAALESDLREAVDQRDRLAAEAEVMKRGYVDLHAMLPGNADVWSKVGRLIADCDDLRDQIATWQTASGLIGGSGDPSDVTPEQLERYIGQLTRVAEAARELTSWDWCRLLVDHRDADDVRSDVARLTAAVDALPKETP